MVGSGGAMAGDCDARAAIALRMKAWAAITAVSGLLGGAAYYYFTGGGPLLLAPIVASLTALTLYHRTYQRRVEEMARLCKACTGDPVFHERRHAVTCARGPCMLCYCYANNRYYAARGEVLEAIPAPAWKPLDFYCAKLLQGRTTVSGNVSVHEGEYIILGDAPGTLVRARGRLAWAGTSTVSSPENLCDIVGAGS